MNKDYCDTCGTGMKRGSGVVKVYYKEHVAYEGLPICGECSHREFLKEKVMRMLLDSGVLHRLANR